MGIIAPQEGYDLLAGCFVPFSRLQGLDLREMGSQQLFDGLVLQVQDMAQVAVLAGELTHIRVITQKELIQAQGRARRQAVRDLTVLGIANRQNVDFNRQVAVVTVVGGIFAGDADARDKLPDQIVVVDQNMGDEPVNFALVFQFNFDKRAKRRGFQLLDTAAGDKSAVFCPQLFSNGDYFR